MASARAKELQLRTKAYAERSAYYFRGFLVEHDTLTEQEKREALCAKLAVEECSVMKNIRNDRESEGTRQYLKAVDMGLGSIMKRWGK